MEGIEVDRIHSRRVECLDRGMNEWDEERPQAVFSLFTWPPTDGLE